MTSPKALSLSLALLTLSAVGLTSGCAAYTKAMGAVMRNSKVVEGHVEAVNTMSVPVCKITLSPAGGEPRQDDDLNGDMLGPGQKANVDIPTIGDPMDLEAPQPEAWDVAVYGCEVDSFGDAEPGGVLLSYSAMKIKKDGTLPLR